MQICKSNVIMLAMAFISLLVYAQPVESTFTINADMLSAIRSATNDTCPDGLITQYWDQYTQITKENDSGPENIFGEREFTDSFGLESKAISAYKAVIDFPNNTFDNAMLIRLVRDYLYNFPYDTFKLAIYDKYNVLPSTHDILSVPSDWDSDANDDDPEWWNLSNYDRARELGYNLIFLSFMADMLYYAHDPSDPEYANKMAVILANLDDLKDWVHSSFYGYNLDGTDTWATRGWELDLVYNGPDSFSVPPKGLCVAQSCGAA